MTRTLRKFSAIAAIFAAIAASAAPASAIELSLPGVAVAAKACIVTPLGKICD
jgi:hypothetical protein